MSANILIREALPDDASATLIVIHRALAEPDNHMTRTPSEFDHNEAYERNFITRLSEDDNALMLVAEDFMHGELVGFLTCEGYTRFARQHVAHLGLIVTKERRGEGIGRRLMEEAIRWAQRHPVIRRLELDVLARNTGAVALYEKFGFQIEGRARGAVRKENTYEDRYYMALRVRDQNDTGAQQAEGKAR